MNEILEDFFNLYPEIETSRLTLRKFSLSDYDDLFYILSDKKNFKYTHNGEALTKEGIEYNLNNYINMDYNKTLSLINYAIVLKDKNKVVGHIYLRIKNGMPIAEISYIMNQEYQNKGYMKEAANSLIKFAFDNLRIKRIYAEPVQNNISSIKVLESLGMKLEGIKRQSYYIDNNVYNECLYGLLIEDFLKKDTGKN